MIAERNKGVFTQPPEAVPDGNVDVSGGGRWKIWQNAGTKIDAPILGNGDLLAAVAGNARYPQFWFTTNDFSADGKCSKKLRSFFMITILPNVTLQ